MLLCGGGMLAQEKTDNVNREPDGRQYSGYFNTSNAVTSAYGNNQAGLTYSDSLNQVTIDYNMLYRNIGDIRNTTSVGYYTPDGTSEYEGTKRYKRQSHNLSAAYQRLQGNHLFNATLYGSIDRSSERGLRTGTINHDSLTYAGDGMRSLRCDSKEIALDLFYSYLLQHGRTFAVNVVNTLGKSYSESEETMTVDAVNADVYDYDRYSGSDNHSYSLIARAYFVTPVKEKGKLTLSSRYEYKQLRQTYTDGKDSPYSHDEYIDAGYEQRWFDGHVTLNTTAGVDILKQVSSARTLTKALPYMRLYTDWWGKNRIEGMTVQLTLTMGDKLPSLSDLNAGITYFGPWLMATGNPEAESHWLTSAKIAFAYFEPKRKWSVQFSITPSYANDHIATAVMKQDGCVFLKPANMGWDFELMSSLRAMWRPVKWLTLEPYLQYSISRYDTPVSSINFRYWRGGGSVTVSNKALSVVLAADSPTKKYDSNLITRGSAQYAAIVKYKIKDWTVGAEYHYSGHDEYITANTPNLYYWDNNDWRRLNHRVSLTLAYSFSKGRSRKHDTKSFNERSDDTGLNKFSKPRGAQ